MKKIIVTTTIYNPSNALHKYASFNEWEMIIVGDLKTPHKLYETFCKTYTNVTYMSPEQQELKYKELSDSIGWNNIQRRSIGFIEAYNRGADIIASVDDDNIPYDDWGKEILIGKEIDVYYYETNEIAFDPIGVTNYKHLWHRGFPLQKLQNKHNYKITIKKIKPDIQANFWNGDPDIDAVCRLEHSPMCFFDKKYFPLATNTFSPFNQQNTLLSRDVIKEYLAMPYIGRMDDIWPSYYVESLGFQTVYHIPTVFQDRNIQNLTKNLKDEFIGYENTEHLLKELKESSDAFYNYLPQKSKIVFENYKKLFN
jgi:hypothetical protein